MEPGHQGPGWYWSRDLLEKGVARNVIYSGAAVQTPYVEGELMALYARAIGVPDGVIHTETNVLHSCENLDDSYQSRTSGVPDRSGWYPIPSIRPTSDGWPVSLTCRWRFSRWTLSNSSESPVEPPSGFPYGLRLGIRAPEAETDTPRNQVGLVWRANSGATGPSEQRG